jgi:hypothetical protein
MWENQLKFSKILIADIFQSPWLIEWMFYNFVKMQMHISKDASSKCIWTLNPPPSSYFCNLMKNVKTNRDPLLAAAGEALLGGNSIRQMLVFLTQKPIFSSISYMRVLFECIMLLELDPKIGQHFYRCSLYINYFWVWIKVFENAEI